MRKVKEALQDENTEEGVVVYERAMEQSQKQLDKTINNLQKRITWLLSKLQTLQNDIDSYNRTANSIYQLISSLERLMKLRGISFDTGQGESLAELLSRISNVSKKVEEVIKHAKT